MKKNRNNVPWCGWKSVGKLPGATVRGGDGRRRKGPEGVKGATLASTRPKGLLIVVARFYRHTVYIVLATKWLRVSSLPPNDKIRNRLVANPILRDTSIVARGGKALAVVQNAAVHHFHSHYAGKRASSIHDMYNLNDRVFHLPLLQTWDVSTNNLQGFAVAGFSSYGKISLARYEAAKARWRWRTRAKG